MHRIQVVILSTLVQAGLLTLVPPSVAADSGAQQHYAEWAIHNNGITAPLDGLTGDPERGRQLVIDRRKGNCLACHRMPIEGEDFQGNLGPPLAGVATRLSGAGIRLRIVDQRQVNPGTVMPGYYRDPARFHRVPEKFSGKTYFTAQEVEDVVAYLNTLKQEAGNEK